MPRQKELEVKIKKLYPDAKLPEYSKKGDAAMDLYAYSLKEEGTEEDLYIEYDTGVAIKVPFGHVGLIFPRSSISNYPLILANAVAVIDSNYTGPLKLRYKASEYTMKFAKQKGLPLKVYEAGDRIGQLMIVPIPKIKLTEVDKLPKTNRGEKGFGSSGK